MKPISIFNEVLGPIMRGPSSSHTAGAYRIGLIARNLFARPIAKVIIEFSTKGSLPTTYHSQGSEIGLLSGLMGYELESDEIKDIVRIAAESGLENEIIVNDKPCDHPNTYNLTLISPDSKKMELTGISVGGGMVRIIRVNGKETDFEGDTYGSIEGVGKYEPILPIHYSADSRVPFSDALEFEQMDLGRAPYEYALDYESARGGMTREEVWAVARKVLRTMRKSLDTGLAGTYYKDRILGQQFHLIDEGVKKDTLIHSSLINRIEKYVLAIMECKSAFGVLVAAPTAGACAVIPASILAYCDEYGRTEDDAVKALLASGLIGMFIAKDATFSAEVAGCQAECGSASGMAAAAIVQLMGGNARTAVNAASFALQNVLGMICDPIANRVEAPCLGKNIMCAMNAISAANIIVAGIQALVPLSQVIPTMDKVGRSIAHELRCTSLGGLSICKASKEIECNLKNL